MSVNTESADAEKQLKGFIAKFDSKNQALIRGVRQALQKRFPTANEIVYDNYNFFVIGYGPSERPSECVVSLAAAANGVGLCFIHGASLPDPNKVLIGQGKQTRFLRLPSTGVLERPEVNALLDAAVARAKKPFPSSGQPKLIIRFSSARQRPRRKV